MDFYKGCENFIEFSAAVDTNPFGAQLLAILEKQFDSLPEAVDTLVVGLNELGLPADEDGVIALLTGELDGEVFLPSPEVIDALEGLAESPAEALRLRNSAAQAYDLVADAIDAQEDGDDEDVFEEDDEFDTVEDDRVYVGDDEDDQYEEEEDQSYSAEDVAIQLYSRQQVTDMLHELSDVADQMLAGGQGLMTPHIKQLLFGQNDKNRYLNFAAAVEDSGYTQEEYLKCLEFSLNLLSELDGVNSVYFSASVEEEVADNLQTSSSNRLNFSQSDKAIEDAAREMFELMKNK